MRRVKINHRWSYDDIQELRDKYPILTMRELMAHFGKNKSQIDNALRRYGIRNEMGKNTRLTAEQKAKVIELSARLTSGQISVRTGLKVNNIKYYLRKQVTA